jgi:hypothetical protein
MKFVIKFKLDPLYVIFCFGNMELSRDKCEGLSNMYFVIAKQCFKGRIVWQGSL